MMVHSMKFALKVFTVVIGCLSFGTFAPSHVAAFTVSGVKRMPASRRLAVLGAVVEDHAGTSVFEEPALLGDKVIDSEGLPVVAKDVVGAFERCLSNVKSTVGYDTEISVPLGDPSRLRRIEIAFESFYELCRTFEKTATEEEISAVRTQTRSLASDLLSSGPFGFETVHWPRGPGSSNAMRMVYEGVGSLPTYSAAAHYLEWYLRTQDLAHAVRSRKDTLRDLLSDELAYQAAKSPSSSIRVLDLANGPFQSLKEIIIGKLVTGEVLNRVDYQGFDTDARVQQENEVWMKETNPSGRYDFHAADAVRTPFSGVQLSYPNDIVYSTGFFDYLPDSLLVKYWKKIYKSLGPGGSMIISLKDSDHYRSQNYHYLFKWDQFYQRNKEHFEMLLQEADLSPERCIRDDTGIILFYVVRKTYE